MKRRIGKLSPFCPANKTLLGCVVHDARLDAPGVRRQSMWVTIATAVSPQPDMTFRLYDFLQTTRYDLEINREVVRCVFKELYIFC